jgi:hypothetical protein
LACKKFFALLPPRLKGRTIFVADAHRDDGKRFVVRADEKLTAFIELEAATKSDLIAPSHSGRLGLGFTTHRCRESKSRQSRYA